MVAQARTWVQARDRGLLALRRAARAAILMPALFALGDVVIGSTAVATFAAFGSFALLILVDFTGPIRDRLFAQVALGLAGAALVCVGTAASRATWLAVLATFLVGFAVIFAGVVSSVLAGATVSLLLAFVLPVTIPGPLSSIPERLAGWGLAAGASVVAIGVLWPAPARDPLRNAATAACRALAAQLRADVAYLLEHGATTADRDAAAEQASSTVAALGRLFFATPWRPTGLGTAARAVVRLVDELNWLHAIAEQTPKRADGTASRGACAVKVASAAVLEHGAELLERPGGEAESFHAAIGELGDRLAELETSAARELPLSAADGEHEPRRVISALDPSFRAQELTFAVSQIAANIELATMADRRSVADRLLGRQAAGLGSTFMAAQERAAGHVERHSVWLHNSVRGAIGLAAAVGVAAETGVQHSFWVVLGTLSVLRSSALGTGQNIVRSLLGTAAGFAIGGALLWAIGSDRTVLWVLLPIAILVAGFAPAAISFAAGQAAFTVTLLILFNILQPVGWRVGIVRIEDIAIGCAVSLGVGVLLWPRGAAAALGRALGEAYAESSRYLTAAVEFGLGRCAHGAQVHIRPDDEAADAASAARRLDDAFRTYLAERGAKPMPLAGVTSLVNGVVGLRLAANAVLDLWSADDGSSASERAAASSELRELSGSVAAWYETFAAEIAGGNGVEPTPSIQADPSRLVDAVRRDLVEDDGRAKQVAVRLIWTADHLDAARRLQGTLVEPAVAFRRSAAHGRLSLLSV